jgi:hypothetical protein
MADSGAGEKLKVFISYSRRDSAAFADELVAGLELAGLAPFLDRHDIAPGEDWEARLGGLIAQSDTVVFVVSPEAVKSERCVWEVDRTLELSKRLLPVVFKPVPERDIPEKLRRLQFIRFDSGPGFARPLSQLAESLRLDLDWIREHTRLGELATRWDRRRRSETLLLRGDEIDAAKAWMVARKTGAPEITDAQRAFISASEEAESARLWDAASRKEIAVLGHDGHVFSAAFSPDGARIVTTSVDETAHIWDAHLETMSVKDLLTKACERLTSLTKMTRDEMRLVGYPDSTAEIDVCQ